ncbi:MAG: nitrous oxide reductase family maturation protein NosD [Methanosarcinales archaeon]
MIKVFTAFILILTFASFASAQTPIVVCPSGCDYSSIQSAIDSANLGDTIEVESGTYKENVYVNKQLVLCGIDTGTGKPVVDAGGSGSAITLSADGVTLEGFEARNSGYAGISITSNHNVIKNNTASNNYIGIKLSSSSNNTLSTNNANSNNWAGIELRYSSNNTLKNNNISNNYNGIYLSRSSNNTLKNNNANSNNNYGIYLSSSSSNTLSNNNASNNFLGISLDSSSNNTLKNNSMFNNKYNFGVYGNELSDFIQYIDKTNYVNGKTIYYLVSEKNLQIPRDAGYVGIVNSENITVKYLTLTNNRQGILLSYTSNSRIEKVIAENNFNGIELYYSSNNKIYLNNFNSVASAGPTNNFWNSTEKITYTYNSNNYTNYLGNYWSDYAGTDADKDGIRDAPYTIDSDKDYYPLMEPFENYLGVALTSQPTPKPTPTPKLLGFEAFFALAGLLAAVAYLVLRPRK